MLAQSTKSSTTIIILLVCALVVVGILIWWKFLQTYHLAAVDDGILYRDGNRGMREFANMVRKIKPRTVVTLIDDKELADPTKPQFSEELEFLKAQGVNVERINVKLGGWPTTADVQRFLQVTQDKKNQPVIVHCAQGVRRTGMFVAAYQESILGWDNGKVKQSMLTFGHSQRTVKDVERFIEAYDAKERKVIAEFELSDE